MELTAHPITAAAFAPYGTLIEAGPQATGRPINGGSSLRFEMPGALALTDDGGRACLAIFRAQAQDPRGPWRTLERHRLGTQTFVPMGSARCVVLVALGGDTPDPATLAAFVVSGQQGLTLHAGTWHHGLLALDDGDFVVLERRADRVDCDEVTLDAPVTLRLA